MTQTHAGEFAGVDNQNRLDVAQALAPTQLGEGHDPELLGAVETANPPVATMTFDDASNAGPRNQLHELSEQRLASVHADVPEPSVPAPYLPKRSIAFKSTPAESATEAAPLLAFSSRKGCLTGHC